MRKRPIPRIFGAPVAPRKQQFAREQRRRPTAAELAAWAMLRNRRLLGFKFRRQQIIRGFIVDFYCHELSLAIELDGPIHDGQQTADAARQQTLEDSGIRFIRLRNDELSLDTLIARFNAYQMAHKQPAHIDPSQPSPA